MCLLVPVGVRRQADDFLDPTGTGKTLKYDWVFEDFPRFVLANG